MVSFCFIKYLIVFIQLFTWIPDYNCQFPLSYEFHDNCMMTSSNGNIFHVTGPVPGEFPAQRPVTRSYDVFFDLRLNERLSKQSWCWWFETPSHPLWRRCEVIVAMFKDRLSGHGLPLDTIHIGKYTVYQCGAGFWSYLISYSIKTEYIFSKKSDNSAKLTSSNDSNWQPCQ